MIDIPLPAFHMCSMTVPLWAEWAYVAGVGICGTHPLLRKNRHATLTHLIVRPGYFRLYRRVHKEIQGCNRARTHVIAPREDLDPGLDDLFLYHVDV